MINNSLNNPVARFGHKCQSVAILATDLVYLVMTKICSTITWRLKGAVYDRGNPTVLTSLTILIPRGLDNSRYFLRYYFHSTFKSMV